MNFKNWMKINESVEQLPPIPNGFVRLTHFTSPAIAKSLINGQDFKAGKGLRSTTDVFSDNNDVINLIQTGKTGAFERKPFGNCVIIMDMSQTEQRMRSNFSSGLSNFVPNDRIVGYYDIENQTFVRNPKFSIKQVEPEMPATKQLSNRPNTDQQHANIQNIKKDLVPSPNNNASPADDIW